MIDVLDIFAFGVFAVLLAAGVVIVVSLGSLPGKIAHRRGHPQAAAVTVAGWLGVATAGLLWPVALICYGGAAPLIMWGTSVSRAKRSALPPTWTSPCSSTRVMTPSSRSTAAGSAPATSSRAGCPPPGLTPPPV